MAEDYEQTCKSLRALVIMDEVRSDNSLGRDAADIIEKLQRERDAAFAGNRHLAECLNAALARVAEGEKLLREARDVSKRLQRFTQDAPRCDFKEDRTLSWISVTSENTDSLLSRIDAHLGAGPAWKCPACKPLPPPPAEDGTP